MNRIQQCTGIAAGICLAALTPLTSVWSAPAEGRPPNIVLILADDQGFETVEAYGGESYETPRIDRLAEQGMRFTHAYAQPVCTPSRVKIMTGMSNIRNYERFGVLPKDQITFANILRDAGYATGIAGKWQLNLLGKQEAVFKIPSHFGFDSYHLWQLNLPGSRQTPRYANPVFESDGKILKYTDGEFGPDLNLQYAKDFMTRHRDEPFLFYYPMLLPHWPFVPTPDSEDWDPTARDGKENRRYYGDMVEYVDKLTGELLDHLHELGIAENTLVIFATDHGSETGLQSQWEGETVTGNKRSMKEVNTRVPFIAYWPGTIEPGVTTDALVDFSDILPTFVELAGAELPGDRIIDGVSFLPVLKGQSDGVRDWLYMWYNDRGGDDGQVWARTQQYKLYRNDDFYDMAADWGEEHPLDTNALNARQKAVRQELRGVIQQYSDQRYQWKR